MGHTSEAAALAEARADLKAGRAILDADLDAFLDGLVGDVGPEDRGRGGD